MLAVPTAAAAAAMIAGPARIARWLARRLDLAAASRALESP